MDDWLRDVGLAAAFLEERQGPPPPLHTGSQLLVTAAPLPPGVVAATAAAAAAFARRRGMPALERLLRRAQSAALAAAAPPLPAEQAAAAAGAGAAGCTCVWAGCAAVSAEVTPACLCPRTAQLLPGWRLPHGCLTAACLPDRPAAFQGLAKAMCRSAAPRRTTLPAWLPRRMTAQVLP